MRVKTRRNRFVMGLAAVWSWVAVGETLFLANDYVAGG